MVNGRTKGRIPWGAIIIALFILLPWLEAVVLLRFGAAYGFSATLGVILLTGVVGGSLARHEGLRAVHRIRATLAAGRLPATELVDGVLILAAGLLLITPGFITDAVGFLLLIRQVRAAFRRGLIAQFKHRITVHSAPGPGTQGRAPFSANDSAGEVIDVEAEVLPPDDQ